jgi:N-acetylglutamate synthase/N-acetylornithine aminotransferase
MIVVPAVGGALPDSAAETIKVADLNAASNLLKREDVFITLDLGLGDTATTVWTCDFSKEYVEVNAHYTT